MNTMLGLARTCATRLLPLPERVEFLGIHGSVLLGNWEPGDIDLIAWVDCHRKDIVRSSDTVRWIDDVFVQEVSNYFEPQAGYECSHLKMIGRSFLFRKVKLSIHLVSSLFLRSLEEEICSVRREGTVDSIASLAISPFRAWRLWVDEVEPVWDPKELWKTISDANVSPSPQDIELGKTMTLAAIAHIRGAREPFYREIAFAALQSYLLTLVFYVNEMFLGTQKGMLRDLSRCVKHKELVIMCRKLLTDKELNDECIGNLERLVLALPSSGDLEKVIKSDSYE